jgi:ABC-type lipoprotein release transport system permease subunit
MRSIWAKVVGAGGGKVAIGVAVGVGVADEIGVGVGDEVDVQVGGRIKRLGVGTGPE